MKLHELATFALFGIAAIIGLGVNEGYEAIKDTPPISLSDCQTIAVEVVQSENGRIEKRKCLDGEA